MIAPLECSASPFSSTLPTEEKANKTIELAIKIFCHACKKENPQAKLCSRCKQIYYCNKTCQTKNWPLHKIVCKPPVPIQTLLETTFSSEKLILNLKQIGKQILPVYSKKNLSSGLNFSKIANVFAYVMTDQMARAKALIEKKLKENPQMYGVEIYIPNTTFINNISHQFSEFRNEIRSNPEKKHHIQNLEITENLFKEFLEGEPVIKLSTIPKDRDILLKEFKIRSELFVYTNID